MRPWLPGRRFAWEAATKAQDPSRNNFLANFEHTLTDVEVEMIAREQFSDADIHLTRSWSGRSRRSTSRPRPVLL